MLYAFSLHDALPISAGQGVTDAVTATEVSPARSYDRIVALSRSGTTTEIIDVLSATDTPSVLITAVGQGPAAQHASAEVVLDFADETSEIGRAHVCTPVTWPCRM